MKEKIKTTAGVITYKVEKNEKYGDYRVNKYLNGKMVNQRDGNWTKEEAENKAEQYRILTTGGTYTMNDNF